MPSHTGIRSKLRRFNRKYGVWVFVGLMIVAVVALVGFVTYALTSPNWRPRW